MDDVLKRRQSMNSFIFKSSLERIIDKYSKLQYQDGDVEVDLDSITTQPQDVTRDSELDFSYQDGGADDTCVSTAQLSEQDDGMSTNDSTGLTVSSLDESQRNVSEMEVQPEDGDEVLEIHLQLLQLQETQHVSKTQETWMSERSHVSAADCSGMGSSLESSRFSPRKC